MKPIITVTSNALNKLNNIIHKHNCKRILLSVKSGGCNGFAYNLEPISRINLSQNIEINEVLLLCKKSEIYVFGMTIDLKENIMGETFTFNNPTVTSKCGCGESFNM